MAKPRKQRVEFRKNRSTRRRDGDLTRTLGDDPDALLVEDAFGGRHRYPR